jgi:hypothetical protein
MTVNGTYIVALGFGQTLLVERGYAPVAAASLASLLPLLAFRFMQRRWAVADAAA